MTTLLLIISAIMIIASFVSMDINDKQTAANHKASRDAITPDMVDALIDAIYIERQYQVRGEGLQSIIDDREEVLADVDSILFERGEFPGSTLVISDADFCRLVRVISRVYEDCHYHIPSTKSYMRAALSV
jgi:hypothetical protein